MNNRQNGRRRGRGGQQARNGQAGPNNGSRLDNRARGNAAQLLEKYKNLARDAQMQGDRVNTEYYLQFADHYFRVLSESRARFEEQRPQRQTDYRDDFGDDDGVEAAPQRGRMREEQGSDDAWADGEQSSGGEAETGSDAHQSDDVGERSRPAPRARGRARRNGEATEAQPNGFAAPDFLSEPLQARIEAVPDANGAEQPSLPIDEAGEPAPKRRRTRRPRAEAAPAEAEA